MIKHSSAYHLLTVQLPPIIEIYIKLYGWERCPHTTEKRQLIESRSDVECSDVLSMRNRILLLLQQNTRYHAEFSTESLVILRYHECDTICTINLFVFSNVVRRFSWHSIGRKLPSFNSNCRHFLGTRLCIQLQHENLIVYTNASLTRNKKQNK